MPPPADAISIGEGHAITFVEYRGDTAGIDEYHRKPDGIWCAGWVCFKGSAWQKAFGDSIESWDVIKREPLTLQPSIRCKACGSHGYITEGKWVPA